MSAAVSHFPAPGTVRVFDCSRCGDHYVETWHTRTATGFTLEGARADGTPIASGVLDGCRDLDGTRRQHLPHAFDDEGRAWWDDRLAHAQTIGGAS